ncbi:hypothetical protein [Oecophyllibacter saccharovorans]|uniref:Uncharacterized protein n=1 Tax=Oecophyllibacter saccharovorans TaxID=2558360 RepID=A0A506URF2_9PROT|nr:hypothetical protein [Oecophyllibacter saccharovorans]TPW34984.1 hypothetical protein E3203_05680 [Oecophyllibacter saccharovorans]TPW35924.1 hypothetical protein E3202_03120 [Oecophyllibacter saccharovorans]
MNSGVNGSCLKDRCCPVVSQVSETVRDMVIDRPWLWTLGALIVGIMLGRRPCCRKKKGCHDHSK